MLNALLVTSVDGKYKNAKIRKLNVTALHNKMFTLQSLYIQIRLKTYL